MQKGDDNNKNSNFLDKTYTKWLVAYLVLGFAIYLIIPFQLSLLASLGITLLMIVLLNAHSMKKFKLDDNNSNNNSKNSGRKGIFNSLSLSLYDDPRAIFGYNTLKFYCMDCGKEHRKRICPKCGSMAVRVG